jgi:hypothetical protein
MAALPPRIKRDARLGDVLDKCRARRPCDADQSSSTWGFQASVSCFCTGGGTGS